MLATEISQIGTNMAWLPNYNRKRQFAERKRTPKDNALKDSTNSLNVLKAKFQANKKQRVSKTANVKMFRYGDENNNVKANLAMPHGNLNIPVKRPSSTTLLETAEFKAIRDAAQCLVSLSAAISYSDPWPWSKKGNKPKANKPKPKATTASVHTINNTPVAPVATQPAKAAKSDSVDENNPLDSEEYRRRAQELLFRTSDILLGERKDAFFELVKQLCPYIQIVRSGSRTLRTYLVDTRKRKRYRTYSDAIKGGALDPLLIETGTTVLLRGCVEEAYKRFAQLSKEQQNYIRTLYQSKSL